jgi:sugar phosphate isomerase/epimerase
MKTLESRRGFLKTAAVAGAAASVSAAVQKQAAASPPSDEPPLRIGIMTYTLGKDWDQETLIKNCQEAQWEHAELRTTHAHGVEVSLSKAERGDVRKRFEDAGIKLSLASAFSYHWEDAEKLREHIEGTKQYTLLAHDIGALGIRVFPNALPADKASVEKTLAQIGEAAAEVATFASDYGVEIRLANHGKGTNSVPVIRRILDYADCEHLYVNWNCDRTDVEAPGFEENFNSVKDQIRNIHLHDLTNEQYPYRKLFALLREANYAGYCDAEVDQSCEPVKFMQYYRALFLALQNEL